MYRRKSKKKIKSKGQESAAENESGSKWMVSGGKVDSKSEWRKDEALSAGFEVKEELS